MISKAAIAFAAASLALGLAFLTPANANYAPCYENPAAAGCPGEVNPKTSAQSYQGAEQQTRHTTRHHG